MHAETEEDDRSQQVKSIGEQMIWIAGRNLFAQGATNPFPSNKDGDKARSEGLYIVKVVKILIRLAELQTIPTGQRKRA